MFKKPFSFTGRIRRLEFGITVIISVIVSLIAQTIVFQILMSTYLPTEYPDGSISYHQESTTNPIIAIVILIIIGIPLAWFNVAQTVKRWHDAGYSGWMVLIPLGFIPAIFISGNVGSNKYGTDPKMTDQNIEIDSNNKVTTASDDDQVPPPPLNNKKSSPPPINREKEYYVEINNEQSGPFNIEKIKLLVEINQINKSTLIWEKSLTNWTSADEVPEIKKLLN